MSDAEHLIENAIMALERYPYEEAERYFMEAPINIMMAKDSGCPLNVVWEMAIYCDTTLRQDWKEKWEKETEVNGYNLDEKWPSLFQCSVCKWSCSDTIPGDTAEYNYCPNCGAKMEGGTK